MRTNSRQELTKSGVFDIMKEPPQKGGRKGAAIIRSAVWLHPPRGGEARAYYISCGRLYSHYHDQETQKPPLWQVTVSMDKVET